MYLVKIESAPLITLKEDVVSWQVNSLLSLIRSYHYKRALENADSKEMKTAKERAFVQIHNTSYLNFMIEWCKIFGSNNNKTHWIRARGSLKTNDGSEVITEEQYINVVKNYIKDKVKISFNKMRKIKKSIKRGRDRYAAHTDIDRIPQMPFIDDGYKIAVAYLCFLTKSDDVDFQVSNIKEEANTLHKALVEDT